MESLWCSAGTFRDPALDSIYNPGPFSLNNARGGVSDKAFLLVDNTRRASDPGSGNFCTEATFGSLTLPLLLPVLRLDSLIDPSGLAGPALGMLADAELLELGVLFFSFLPLGRGCL